METIVGILIIALIALLIDTKQDMSKIDTDICEPTFDLNGKIKTIRKVKR